MHYSYIYTTDNALDFLWELYPYADKIFFDETFLGTPQVPIKVIRGNDLIASYLYFPASISLKFGAYYSKDRVPQKFDWRNYYDPGLDWEKKVGEKNKTT